MKIWPQQKYIDPADLDSPCRILVCGGLGPFWGASDQWKIDILASQGSPADLCALDNIMLVRISNSLVRNIFFYIFFKSLIQQIRITLVVCFQLTKKLIWAQRASFVPKTPLKNTFSRWIVKRTCFEVLQQKSSIMPRVVWAEESKTGLGFEIGSPQQKLWWRPDL